MKRELKEAESPEKTGKKTKRDREKRDHHWRWLPRMFIKPRGTLAKVNDQDKAVWFAPLLILAVMVLLAVVFAAPIKRVNIQTGATIPEDFQWWSQERQQQFLQAQQNLTSPTFMYLFPLLSGLAGYLLFWVICSSLLYLSLTLAGSRTTNQKVSNLIAWAMIPFALRELIKVIVIISSKRLIAEPGLSYLVASEATGIMAWLKGILGQVDFYGLLFVIFLFLGAIPLSGLRNSKAVLATTVALILVLVLVGLPSVISTALSGLGGSGYYFF
ncbi:MAG TPA: YIP1 family protein [Anaerolineaceae bacterium]|nr:YIP1 family protein [Anaerolineaceae bacterium]